MPRLLHAAALALCALARTATAASARPIPGARRRLHQERNLVRRDRRTRLGPRPPRQAGHANAKASLKLGPKADAPAFRAWYVSCPRDIGASWAT